MWYHVTQDLNIRVNTSIVRKGWVVEQCGRDWRFFRTFKSKAPQLKLTWSDDKIPRQIEIAIQFGSMVPFRDDESMPVAKVERPTAWDHLMADDPV